jgi:hypothetical protein
VRRELDVCLGEEFEILRRENLRKRNLHKEKAIANQNSGN